MKASVKLGHVYGVELGLHYSWFVIALLIVFSLGSRFQSMHPAWGPGIVWATAIATGILFFVGLFAHELSHALVAKSHGLPIHKITLFLLGGMAQIEKEASDASTEFWMGIVGPITSAVIGVVLLIIAVGVGWTPRSEPTTPGLALLVWLGYINLALGAFNMIPGFPLDGGRVLRGIIWWITGNGDKATRAATTVGQVVAVLFIGYGVFSLFGGDIVGGIWIAFIGWFLLQASGVTKLQMQAENLLRDVRVRDVMSQECTQVDANIPVQDLIDMFILRTGRRCFVVMQDGAVAGLITPNEITKIERERRSQVPVRAAMRPIAEIHSLPPDAPVMQAMEMMANEDINQLPVISDGHLDGVVSRSHILQVLQSRSALSSGRP